MPSSTLPASLKSLQHYLKIASEHEKRNPVVSYYARMYVAQQGIKIDGKSPESKAFLFSLMDELEASKKLHASANDAFKSDVVAQAVLEEYCLKLFDYADAEDRAERFGKSLIKAFYTAGMLMDVLSQFGDQSEEIKHKCKYSKWKAAHINVCLRNGEKPHPGPIGGDEEEGAEEQSGAVGGLPDPPSTFNAAYQPQNPAYPDPNASQSNPAAVGFGAWTDPRYASPSAPAAAPAAAPVAAPRSIPAAATAPSPSVPSGGVVLTPEHFQRGQKLIKFASSALNYEDTPTAIDNLEKALRLLKTGRE